MHLVWASGKGYVLAGLVLMTMAGLLPLLSLYLQKLLIDGIATSSSPFAFDELLRVIALLALAEVLAHTARLAGTYASEAQSQTVMDHVAGLIHEKSTSVDLAYFENPKYYDTIHRAQLEGPSRPALIVNGLANTIQSGIGLIAICAFVISFHWGLALLLIGAVIPGLLVRLNYSRKLFKWQRTRTATERRAFYYHQVLSLRQFAKEVRIFGIGKVLRQWYAELRSTVRSEKLRLTRSRCGMEIMVQTIASIALYGAYLLIAWKTVNGTLTLGDMVIFYQAFIRAQASLRSMLQGIASLYENNLFLSNLYEFLDLDSSLPRADASLPSPKEPLPMRVQNVSYRYPESSRDALRDVNMLIEPGSHVAIVGVNGSGKSTLVKLLSRLYEPTSGEIRLGSHPATDFELTRYRQQFSILFQDYAQYDLTVRQNIALGSSNAEMNLDSIRDVARQTGADRIVEKLPDGYETLLGKQFVGGEGLSHGEWQRIAFARALLADSNFVILDEPTSSMDPEMEYELFQNIHSLTKGRTLVFISHRLSTVRMADRIHVLENGSIIESGTHDELVSRGARYADLYEAQVTGYR